MSLSFLLVELANLGKQACVSGVDHFRGSLEENNLARIAEVEDVETQCMANLDRASYPYKLFSMPSVAAAAQFANASIDGIFVDGSHDYDSVCADLAAWLPKVKAGGVFAGHDINQPAVRRALLERFGENGIEELPNPAFPRGWQWGLCWRRK